MTEPLPPVRIKLKAKYLVGGRSRYKSNHNGSAKRIARGTKKTPAQIAYEKSLQPAKVMVMDERGHTTMLVAEDAA